MQLAYEISKDEGGHGKLVFDSSYESGAFYHKLGFRALSRDPNDSGKIDEEMAQCVKKIGNGAGLLLCISLVP